MSVIIQSVTSEYATFSGRTSRRRFVTFVIELLVVVLLSIPLTLMSSVATLLFVIAMGVLIIPTWAIVVRRLHDVGFSGWWSLLQFIPLGSLVLMVLTLLPGQKGENQYGSPGHASRDNSQTPQEKAYLSDQASQLAHAQGLFAVPQSDVPSATPKTTPMPTTAAEENTQVGYGSK